MNCVLFRGASNRYLLSIFVNSRTFILRRSTAAIYSLVSWSLSNCYGTLYLIPRRRASLFIPFVIYVCDSFGALNIYLSYVTLHRRKLLTLFILWIFYYILCSAIISIAVMQTCKYFAFHSILFAHSIQIKWINLKKLYRTMQAVFLGEFSRHSCSQNGNS